KDGGWANRQKETTMAPLRFRSYSRRGNAVSTCRQGKASNAMISMTSIHATALVLAVISAGPASDETPANDKIHDEHIRPFLARHCLGCHGGEKPKADFHLDRLGTDFANEVTRERWLTVLEGNKASGVPTHTRT